MLSKKQIYDLPIGDYPNWRLMQMFPNQQGTGRSAKFVTTKVDGKEGKGQFIGRRLMNQFTGKFIDPARKGKKKNKF